MVAEPLGTSRLAFAAAGSRTGPNPSLMRQGDVSIYSSEQWAD
jgi:hypothetical protein